MNILFSIFGYICKSIVFAAIGMELYHQYIDPKVVKNSLTFWQQIAAIALMFGVWL